MGVPDDSDEGNESDDNNNKNNDESKMTGVEKEKAELLLLRIQTRDRRKEGNHNQKNDGQDIAQDQSNDGPMKELQGKKHHHHNNNNNNNNGSNNDERAKRARPKDCRW